MIYQTFSNQVIHITEDAVYQDYFTFMFTMITSCGIVTEKKRLSFTYGQYDSVEDYIKSNYRVK